MIDKKKAISYDNIMYGFKIKLMKKTTMCNGVSLVWKEVNFPITDGKHCLFVAQHDEALSNGDMFIVDTPIGEVPSGIVVLMMCSLNYQRDRTWCKWGRDHFNIIHQSKPSILAGNNKHHGSNGYSYSYGNKGCFCYGRKFFSGIIHKPQI